MSQGLLDASLGGGVCHRLHFLKLSAAKVHCWGYMSGPLPATQNLDQVPAASASPGNLAEVQDPDLLNQMLQFNKLLSTRREREAPGSG